MRIEDRDDFVDVIAQAVIDRIEERDRIAGLVDVVVRRVFELQQKEAAALAQAAAPDTSSEGTPEAQSPVAVNGASSHAEPKDMALPAVP